jgi:hypothetical protein
VALQFVHGGEDGPDQPGHCGRGYGLEAAGDIRLEGEPALQHAVGFGGVFAFRQRFQPEGLVLANWLFSMSRICIAAFHGLDVPGEDHEIAPVAISLEHVDGIADVALLQRLAELVQKALDLGGWCLLKHVISSASCLLPMRRLTLGAAVPKA